MAEITYIAVNKLHPHPDNPRKELGDLSELAASIKANGVYQNLTVVRGHYETKEEFTATAKAEGVKKSAALSMYDPKGTFLPDDYTIIIGHRRAAAAQLAGLNELPCVVVEMSDKEQMQTMLVENMQRSDLTVYEQAQGFQLMLDFGDNVEQIAEKSGFSQTTVRRRVKLLDLDKDKFKQAEKRGATMQDYMELEKIEDLEEKNLVLDAIGTANFKQRLNEALARQKFAKRKAEWLEVIKTFATEDPEASWNTRRFIGNYCYYNLTKEVEVPQDADTVKYYYKVSDREIDLYKERDDEQENAEQAKREQERIQREAIANEFRDASKAAYQLRVDFVRGLSNQECKQNFGDISTYMAHAVDSLMNSGYCRADGEDIAYLLGFKADEVDSEEWADNQRVQELIRLKPEKAVLCMAFAIYDSADQDYWDNTWAQGRYVYHHEPNAELDATYDLLEKLGYELSDAEKSLRDGSNELFAKYGEAEQE